MAARFSARQLILALLSLYAALLLGSSLIGSFNQPQIQDRLELYQTNLLLQASEWQGDPNNPNNPNWQQVQMQVLGQKPLEKAREQYQAARETAEAFAVKHQTAATVEGADEADKTEKPDPKFMAELTLKQGILEATQGDTEAALQTWSKLREPGWGEPFDDLDPAQAQRWSQVATILTGLWSQPPELLPQAESQLQAQLGGWFRYRSLQRLYQLQQRVEALQTLEAQAQSLAEQTVIKLVVLSILPVVGSAMGVVLVIFFTVQGWLNRRQDRSTGRPISGPSIDRSPSPAPPLSPDEATTMQTANPEAKNISVSGGWQVPWNGEIIWQVIVAGFFFIGQIVASQLIALIILPQIPALLGLIGVVDPNEIQIKAVSVVFIYGTMSLSVLGFLYFSLKPYFPLPQGWFRFRLWDNWLGWGVAGYLMALPLVIVVSLVNQQIWQGQGGSNPILSLALQNKDTLALGCFFFTAAIAAPLFEEFLFRGFLMASLTRYLPQWGAIGLSAFIFALAHLSLSEVLPLFVLGAVLGYVYDRSRNLLAPMLLHGLWNSGTLVGLVILGSGT